MGKELQGKRIAILAADGVERVELEQPRGALYGTGAQTDLLSIHPGEIQARQFDMISAGTLSVDRQVTDASVDEYDALLLPGGTVNPDQLRINKEAMAFLKAFVATGKPIASLCHGPWTLLEADAVSGRRLTSWPSLWSDLRHDRAECSTRSLLSTGSSPPAAPRLTCWLTARPSSSSLRRSPEHRLARRRHTVHRPTAPSSPAGPCPSTRQRSLAGTASKGA
jgi:protease I